MISGNYESGCELTFATFLGWCKRLVPAHPSVWTVLPITSNVLILIKRIKKTDINLHCIARRRGIIGGLLGGLELLLFKLLRLSIFGDACTVILCWKSVKKEKLVSFTVSKKIQDRD